MGRGKIAGVVKAAIFWFSIVAPLCAARRETSKWRFSFSLNTDAVAGTFQTEFELDSGTHEVFRTTHKVEYTIGSGVNGYTFLVRRGNYLFQAPLSYYARKETWDLSPGYEFADYGFNRPIAAACIGCHSGQPQPVRDREGLFGDPPFREMAIGCENCHGPASGRPSRALRDAPSAR